MANAFFGLANILERAAAGIEHGNPQACQGMGARGAEATLGAPANPLPPPLQARITGESPTAAQNLYIPSAHLLLYLNLFLYL